MARRKLPLFLDDTEPERLLAVTGRERDRLILLVGLMCGLRVSEICHLRVEDLDFRRRVLWVRQGKGDKDRTVPIPKRLVGPIRGWLGGRQCGYVFPSPYDKSACQPLTSRCVQLLMKRLASAAGLRDAGKPRRCTPHKLRHAFATRLLESGANIEDVRELLGHSSIVTTQVYLHSSPARLAQVVDRVYQ